MKTGKSSVAAVGLALGFSWVCAVANADTVGNGGDAVVCRDGEKITSVEMLDVYEARVLRGLPLEIEGVTLLDKTATLLRRLATQDVGRTLHIEDSVRRFLTLTAFVDEAQLPDVPDAGDLPLRPNCRIEQVAINRDKRTPHDREFVVNNTLWKLMTDENKAALIFHEVLWRSLRYAGLKDSYGIRYLNSLLFSNEISRMDGDSYIEALEGAGVAHVAYHEVENREPSIEKVGAYRLTNVRWLDKVRKRGVRQDFFFVPRSMNRRAAEAACDEYGYRLVESADFGSRYQLYGDIYGAAEAASIIEHEGRRRGSYAAEFFLGDEEKYLLVSYGFGDGPQTAIREGELKGPAPFFCTNRTR